MKVGILSDTHGNLGATAAAAQLMASAGVEVVFHCGDIGGFDVLTELAGIFKPLAVPVYAIFGNVDIYSDEWKFFPSNLGIHLLGRFGEVELDGRKVALLHGDNRTLFRQTVDGGKYDLVFSGHSHEIHDYRVGNTRCINPGAAGRSAPHTCAVLNLDSGSLVILEC
jgi:putative phosphoesterase